MHTWTIGLALAGLACAACAPDAPPKGPVDGPTLFRQQNCIICHAADGAGTKLGPSLRDKKSFWTREKLAAYIANPPAVVDGDERLKTQSAQYSIPMTTYPGLSLEQRLALADHVLALP